ncbi:MAG: peptidylprolyl isomerase [Isosphaeraceae bacterium]
MWDRIRKDSIPAKGEASDLGRRPSRVRSRRRPLVEVLENRRLMTASLAPLGDLTNVPAKMGFQLPLNGSGSNSPTQTFTATSDNPNIRVSVAQGQFWTMTVSHQASGTPGDVSFTDAPMTFQLFPNLTPNTVSRITNFTNNGYYVNQGKFFPRILSNFVAQGGSTSATSTASSSGVPPIATEIVQQLNFSGSAQLAMANTGAPVSTDAQFFITYGPQTSLNYGYTLFGQLVSGLDTLAKLAQVTVKSNGASPPEISVPDSPVTITSASLSSQNPNGVLLIDATSATSAGQTANITVTATDPSDGTSVSRTFEVTTSAYNGPSNPSINFIPTANPVTVSRQPAAAPVPIQLSATSNYPNTSSPGTLTYSIASQPTKGTITQFNSSTGRLVYVPNPGSTGTDTFQFTATSTGSATGAPASAASLPATVTITPLIRVSRLINNVLIVTPPPRTRKARGTDNIVVSQVDDPAVLGGQRIVVTINGLTDQTQPAAATLDQIVVFGTKANTNIQVDPDVDVPATLDGGHAGRNVVKAGAGPSRLHGWFGHTLLVGGSGPNQLVGRKGVVRFRPTSTTTEIFAGEPKPRDRHHGYRVVPPGGTFYRFARGRIIPIAEL